jgi:hypothetical protein
VIFHHSSGCGSVSSITAADGHLFVAELSEHLSMRSRTRQKTEAKAAVRRIASYGTNSTQPRRTNADRNAADQRVPIIRTRTH